MWCSRRSSHRQELCSTRFFFGGHFEQLHGDFFLLPHFGDFDGKVPGHVRPVTHRRISKKNVLCVLSATWLISFTMAFIPFTWINMEDRRTGSNLNLVHVIFCLLAVFLLPYAFMIYVFVIIFKSISRKERRRRTSYAKSRRSGKQAAVEKKCLMLFVTMAIVFAMCWLPWFVLTLLYRLYYDVEHLETPSHVFVLVRYTTSSSTLFYIRSSDVIFVLPLNLYFRTEDLHVWHCFPEQKTKSQPITQRLCDSVFICNETIGPLAVHVANGDNKGPKSQHSWN